MADKTPSTPTRLRLERLRRLSAFPTRFELNRLVPGGSSSPSIRTTEVLYSIGRHFRFGVETEVLLQPKHVGDDEPHNSQQSMAAFAASLTESHNNYVRQQGREMRNVIVDEHQSPPRLMDRYEYWVLERDESVKTTQLPWGIELISPAIWFSDPDWRRIIDATWGFLEDHYTISGGLTFRDKVRRIDNPPGKFCSTHVHTSKSAAFPFTAGEVMRIAQAMIWWEEAWEAILPRERRRNPYTRSIYVDNRNLRDLTREEAIEEVGKTTTTHALVRLLNPGRGVGSRHWGINFSNLNRPDAIQTIEFRRFGISRNKADVYMCIASAAAFMHAAMQVTDTGALIENRFGYTVAGLKHFMLRAVGPFDHDSIRRLFRGKELKPTKKVRPCPTRETGSSEDDTPECNEPPERIQASPSLEMLSLRTLPD